MRLQQITIKIPDWIEQGLESGELIRRGSEVRNRTGQIVKQLEDVTIEPNTAEKTVDTVRLVAGRGIELTRKYPIVAGAIGLTALVATGTMATRSARSKKAKIQERVNIEDRFTAAATAWIDAASTGTVTSDTVSELQDAWEEYNASNKEWHAQPNDLAISLMQLVQTWNSQNGLRKNLSATPHNSTGDKVVDLSAYLAAQRELLSEAEGDHAADGRAMPM